MGISELHKEQISRFIADKMANMYFVSTMAMIVCIITCDIQASEYGVPKNISCEEPPYHSTNFGILESDDLDARENPCMDMTDVTHMVRISVSVMRNGLTSAALSIAG